MPIELSATLWLAAATPLLVLLALLVWRRWATAAAAPVALVVAVVSAVALFRAPAHTLAVAAGKGLWDAIFILYVVWPSLILYQVANEAGAFGAIRAGVRRLMPDRLLVVLAFSWVLSSFIQSIAGFGTPLAVTTPLLIGIGMRPVYAVVLPLIGAAWANVFGSLGVPWLATTTVVELADPRAAIIQAAALVWIADLSAGLAIAWMYGRTWAIRRALPAILVISGLHGGGQLLLAPLLPSLASLIATGAALAVLLLLTRLPIYRQLDQDEPTRLFLPEAKTSWQLEQEAAQRAHKASPERGATLPAPKEDPTPMPLWLAFAPYGILAMLAIGTLLVPPVRRALAQVQVGLPFPATATGLGIERAATDAYAAFEPLTHPGTLLLLSAGLAYLLFRRSKDMAAGTILRQAAQAALPATTAIAGLLVLSKTLDHTGQVDILARGIAAVASPVVFVAASNLIGALGSLLTSSSTASNVLFAPLQQATAVAEGVPTELVVAGQVAGSAVGGAMSPGDVLLGATVAGAPDKMGAVLAKAIPWALGTALLVSAACVAMYLL